MGAHRAIDQANTGPKCGRESGKDTLTESESEKTSEW